MQYGYARVSTRDQNVDRQLDALRAFPLEERRIYTDYFTGASFERPRYLSLMRKLAPGDVMVVTSIDRLGRNYDEIIQQWRRLTHERHIDIVVLDMPLLDTRARGAVENDVTRKFISDLLLQLLSYVAKWSARTSGAVKPRASPPPEHGARGSGGLRSGVPMAQRRFWMRSVPVPPQKWQLPNDSALAVLRWTNGLSKTCAC
ncbi:recombinase family protein [Collinsella intestinalis]|uniref:recombinase family protein n=1 Tax=Collinsella intestinalis TaxID=147207 RepID=UPI001EF59758|nr:recombinase family protein [Collinsella intestinalis]